MKKIIRTSVNFTLILICFSTLPVLVLAGSEYLVSDFSKSNQQPMLSNTDLIGIHNGIMIQTVYGLEGDEFNSSDEEQILTELLHWFMDGASRNDRAVHDAFWNENLVYTSSAGTRFGKAEIMSGFDDTRNLREVGPTTQYSAQDITVRFFGAQKDVAVVSFRMKGETLTIQGTTTSWYLNSGTLIKIEDEWSVVNWQATRVP